MQKKTTVPVIVVSVIVVVGLCATIIKYTEQHSHPVGPIAGVTARYSDQVPDEVTVGTQEVFSFNAGKPGSKYIVSTNIGELSRSPDIIQSGTSDNFDPQKVSYTTDDEGRVSFSYYPGDGSVGKTAVVHVRKVGGGFDKTYKVKIISWTAGSDAIKRVKKMVVLRSEVPEYRDGTRGKNEWWFKFDFLDANGRSVDVWRSGNFGVKMNRTGARFVGVNDAHRTTDTVFLIIPGQRPSVMIDNLPKDLKANPVHVTATLLDGETPTSITRTIDVGDPPDHRAK